MLLDERNAFGSGQKPQFGPDALSIPSQSTHLPRLVLCASRNVSEFLSASAQFEFVPYGAPDREILSIIRPQEIDGFLVHFESGDAAALEFLEAAGKNFPDLPCFVLCDLASQKEIPEHAWQIVAVRDLGSLSEMEDKLARALFLFPWMRCEMLRKIIVALKTIPAEASNHQKIVRELQNPEFTLENVARMIKQDPALTAQLLKIANSAAFFRASPVMNVDEAVTFLGSVKLRALISSAWAFFLIDDDVCAGFRPGDEWRHAVETTERVTQMCRGEGLDAQATETAVIAALLHDIGKLLLAANLPDDYAKVLQSAGLVTDGLWEVENQMLGFNHAEVAGCLLAIWGMPLSVAEAVMFHHSEGLAADSPGALIQRAHQPGHECSPA
jgi:HD-like signal output (HDOD) protein